MTIAYFIIDGDDDGLWSVRCEGARLRGGLKLEEAIRLARRTARDEHARSGQAVAVDMLDLSSAIRLGRFPNPDAAPCAARERMPSGGAEIGGSRPDARPSTM
jgi:hypothetical protein